MFINTNFKSPNFSERTLPIKYVILHYTEMNFKDALSKLCDVRSEVSAHYLIKEDGEIFQLVNDDKIAWHAGISKWHDQEKLNQNSIGIEIDNLGNKLFAKKQMDACLELCNFLKDKYSIPTSNFIGHSDVAPDRKIDPGIYFDWHLLANHGFGIWHDHMPKSSQILYKFNERSKNMEILQKKLKKLGYNINITSIFDLQTNYVIRAFQAKYYPKLLLKKGYTFYKNLESKYDWCTESEVMLDKLLMLI